MQRSSWFAGLAWTCSGVLWAAGGALAQQPAQQPEAPAFGEVVNVEVINVDALVTDGSGRPVYDLTPQDFRLLVDGREVPIRYFSAPDPLPPEPSEPPRRRRSQPDRPLTLDAANALPGTPPEERLFVSVFIDGPNLQNSDRKRFADRLDPVLERLQRNGALISVVSYSNALRVHNDFTNDPRVLERVLNDVRKSVGGDADAVELRAILKELADARQPRARNDTDFYTSTILARLRAYAQSQDRLARLSLDALARSLGTLSGLPGRRVMLHVSSGLATRPGEGLFEEWKSYLGKDDNETYDDAIGGADLMPVFREVGRLANAAGVTLYMLDGGSDIASMAHTAEMRGGEFGTLSSTNLAIEEANREEPLGLLADTTGGKRLELTSRFDEDLSAMREEILSAYSLGFDSHDAPGENHRIQVRVLEPGLEVRHRETFTSRSVEQRTSAAVFSALRYGIAFNPLDIGLETRKPQKRDDGTLILPVLVKMPVGKLALLPQGDSQVAQLNIFVSMQEANGDPRPIQKIPFHLPIPADKVEEAKGREAAYTLPLAVRPGDLRAVVAVRDEIAGELSIVTLDFQGISGLN